MKFALKDIVVVGISTVIISAASFTLYRDFTARVEGGEREKIGTIIYKKKSAQRKYSGEVIWEDVSRQDTVYNFDSIRTEEGSVSIIKLRDGSEIELKENTLILLSLASGSANINFSRGSISANAVSNLKISAGDTVIDAGKSKLNLAAKADKLNLDIEKGSAVIGDKTIDKNQLAVIGGDKTSIREKEFTLISPAVNGYYLTFRRRHIVKFTWKSKQKKPYLIQVSRNRGFKGKTITRRSLRPSETIILKPGTWFWRVGYRGARPIFSQDGTFTIINEKREQLISPQNGAVYSYVKTQPMVPFRWTGSSAASSYRIELARDRKFSSIAKTLNSNATAISSSALDAGTWFWRVVNIYPFPTGKLRVESPTGKFTLSKSATIPPPLLLKPAKDYRVSELYMRQGRQLFNWQPHDDLQNYRVEIAASKEFKKARLTTTVRASYYQLPTSLPKGKWYWRITGIDREGNTYPSQARNFTVTGMAPITTVTPPDGASLALLKNQKRIAFSWNDPNRGGKYLMEISAKKDFSSILQRKPVTGTGIQLPRPDTDRFFWRISMLDRNNRVITRSNTASVSLSTALTAPVITYPREGGVIDVSKLNTIPIRWRKAAGATHYRIKIFHFARGFTRKIIDTEVKTAGYTLRDMKLLDEGNFSIEVESLKKSKNTLVSRSVAQKRYFSLKLPQKLQNPEIITPNIIYIE